MSFIRKILARWLSFPKHVQGFYAIWEAVNLHSTRGCSFRDWKRCPCGWSVTLRMRKLLQSFWKIIPKLAGPYTQAWRVTLITNAQRGICQKARARCSALARKAGAKQGRVSLTT